jgi:hypothetical protein
MPNWVWNRIEITGTKDHLDALEKKLQGEDTVFDFNALVPRPADKDDDWYNWNVAHWGTKWDAAHPEKERPSDESLSFRFDTAWSPPVGIIDAFIAQHPEVDFVYDYEEEQGWGGNVKVNKGQIIESSTYDIPSTHAENVARYGECHCNEEEPIFDDCLSALAEERRGITGDTLEAAKALSPGWSSGLDELITAAELL